ncbi:hypothetical protein [Pantoea sp. VS1]|uniref:hypothetical protein n=1 Tax=Pantoea sp. VS1 TaxID=2003658 RepID=UPI001131F876|nr:hypothetical protein [Pantoea sp. VS1]
MANDWNEELKAYENGRTNKDDLTDCFSVIFSVASGALDIVSNMPNSSKNLDDELSSDGWKDGTQGYGYYRNGIKD